MKTKGDNNFRLAPALLCVASFLMAGAASGSEGGRNGLAEKGRGPQACTATTTSAYTACGFEKQDDYWIALGNCSNLADASERANCQADARSDRRDGLDECREQKAARGELCEDLGQAPYDPSIDPALFVNPAEIGRSVAPNPYFPLLRNRTWIYRAGTEKVTTTVTTETKVIMGVTCAVVHDVAEDDGEVIEDTIDWYAQDVYGNVWYFGETSQDFEAGELVSLDGSWKAGVDGAKPGLLVKAIPAVGDVYRQEFALGDAEDAVEVLSLAGSISAPAASCTRSCLVTRDFTPLSPDALEHKYYEPGVGPIVILDLANGGREELVSVDDGP